MPLTWPFTLALRPVRQGLATVDGTGRLGTRRPQPSAVENRGIP